MRKIIRKWFWAWDFDREENWLNEMSAKGLALDDVGFCKYSFEECLPGEYRITLEFLDKWPTHPESQQYIKFIEETKAEHLGSLSRWAYFRKKSEYGDFSLHSDNDSKIKHLNRILVLLSVISIANLPNAINNIMWYLNSGLLFNLIVGISITCLSGLLACGALKIHIKKRKLQKEQSIFE